MLGKRAKDVQRCLKNINSFSNNQATVLDWDSELLRWMKICIRPVDGPYRRGRFVFEINFGKSYPRVSPVVTCLTPIYHPNIDSECEEYNVCLSILDEWNENTGLEDLIQGLLYLMYHPNLEDPLSQLFEGEVTYDQFLKNVRLSLRGHKVMGVKFERMVEDDSDGEEGEEAEAEGGGDLVIDELRENDDGAASAGSSPSANASTRGARIERVVGNLIDDVLEKVVQESVVVVEDEKVEQICDSDFVQAEKDDDKCAIVDGGIEGAVGGDTVESSSVNTDGCSTADTVGYSTADLVGHSTVDTVGHSTVDTVGQSIADTVGQSTADTVGYSTADPVRYTTVDTVEHSTVDTAALPVVTDGVHEPRNGLEGIVESDVVRLDTGIQELDSEMARLMELKLKMTMENNEKSESESDNRVIPAEPPRTTSNYRMMTLRARSRRMDPHDLEDDSLESELAEVLKMEADEISKDMARMEMGQGDAHVDLEASFPAESFSKETSQPTAGGDFNDEDFSHLFDTRSSSRVLDEPVTNVGEEKKEEELKETEVERPDPVEVRSERIVFTYQDVEMREREAARHQRYRQMGTSELQRIAALLDELLTRARAENAEIEAAMLNSSMDAAKTSSEAMMTTTSGQQMTDSEGPEVERERGEEEEEGAAASERGGPVDISLFQNHTLRSEGTKDLLSDIQNVLNNILPSSRYPTAVQTTEPVAQEEEENRARALEDVDDDDDGLEMPGQPSKPPERVTTPIPVQDIIDKIEDMIKNVEENGEPIEETASDSEDTYFTDGSFEDFDEEDMDMYGPLTRSRLNSLIETKRNEDLRRRFLFNVGYLVTSSVTLFCSVVDVWTMFKFY